MKEKLLSEYKKNPCATSALPYRKMKQDNFPKDCFVVHKNDFINQWDKYERYFKLKHDFSYINPVINKVETIEVNDIERLVDMINKSYKGEGIEIDKDEIKHMRNNPIFNPSLWLKIEIDSKIIASGIAGYDKESNEGSLEWIQVLPEYRKKGFGQDIVNCLLNRLKEIGAEYVTVSGNLDNITNPEKLYRSCGFFGQDVWYIHRK